MERIIEFVSSRWMISSTETGSLRVHLGRFFLSGSLVIAAITTVTKYTAYRT